ncbi:MAG: DUF2279 domain-containing protein [Candidatus Marinimicrobia bacterium]|nr:DUF2279 domain-containing protein [Candidatus Neomarinimicrobiota bacterium]
MIKSSSLLIINQAIIYKYILQPAWWYGEEVDFHYDLDINYAELADKFGHAYSGYYLSNLNTDLFIAAGFNWNKAKLYSGILSFILLFQLEYKDGLAPDYGFSKLDIYSNTIGIMYFYLQQYIPFFQNFTPKYLYNYPKFIHDMKINSAGLVENYEEITFFMSINVKNLLPNNYKKMWLNGLDLALGYSVRGYNVVGEPRYPLKENYYFGLDFNLFSILPNHDSRWHWVAQTLNSLKLPSPMIEFTENGKKYHLLYPLK